MENTDSAFYPLLWDSLFLLKNDFKQIMDDIENYKYVPKAIDPKLPKNIIDFKQRTETREFQVRLKFNARVDLIRISIILFSATLIENIITHYYARKCLNEASFNKIDKKSLIDKWTVSVKEFIPTFQLSIQSESLLLELVNKRRKLIIHHHPTIIRNGEIMIKGRPVPIAENETELIFKWCDLPAILTKELLLSENLEDSLNLRPIFYNDCLKFGVNLFD